MDSLAFVKLTNETIQKRIKDAEEFRQAYEEGYAWMMEGRKEEPSYIRKQSVKRSKHS